MGNFTFFTLINKYLSNLVYQFQSDLLGRTSQLIAGVALTVVTIWILFHGYRIITGQSRQPMMELVGDSLRAVLIVGVAMSMSSAGNQICWTLTDGTSTAIVGLVTGNSASPFQSIDNNLAYMQMAMSTIDTVADGGNSNIASDLTRDKWMSGAGVAGPAVIAGSLLLLNKIALALFIGFGPLFILCLLFKQTAPLFQRWLLYGIGTVFSLAVLSITVSWAMQMLLAVSTAYAGQYLISMASNGMVSTDGLNSLAMQQGGIGLILTTLIISAPPMAAAFFQGTLGQFGAYSAFGRIGEGPASTKQQSPLFGHSSPSTPPTSLGQGNSPGLTSGGGGAYNNPALTTAYGLPPQPTGQSLS